MAIAAAIAAPTAQAADAPAEPASDSLPALSATQAPLATHNEPAQSPDWVLIGGIALAGLVGTGAVVRVGGVGLDRRPASRLAR